MSIPQLHRIDGSQLTVSIPLSYNFQISHQFNFANRSKQNQMNPAMMMQGGMKPVDPFYTLQTNYVGLDPKKPQQGPKYQLFGMFTSEGSVNAVFMKPWKNFQFKVQSQFQNNYLQNFTNFEVTHQGKRNIQQASANLQQWNYNIMQRISRKTLIGCQLSYLPGSKKLFTGYSLKYRRNASEEYFVEYDSQDGLLQTGMGSAMIYLGAAFKLDSDSHFASTLKFKEGQLPIAKFGFKRKIQSYQVSNSYNTSGTIKTMFTYMQSNMFKLKLYLQGSMMKDDFHSGYAVSIGPE